MTGSFDDEDMPEGLGQALLPESASVPRISDGLGGTLLNGLWQQGMLGGNQAATPNVAAKFQSLADGIANLNKSYQQTATLCALPPNTAGILPPNPKASADTFDTQYGALMKKGDVDIQQNGMDAQNATPWEFYDKIRTGGDWDYKKYYKKDDPNSRFAGFSGDQVQRFGNANFGYVGAARGLPLWQLVQGAGLYQTFSQDKTPWRGLSEGALDTFSEPNPALPGAWDLPDDDIRQLAAQGCRFGDNPDDTPEIIKGYDYYHALQALKRHKPVVDLAGRPVRLL